MEDKFARDSGPANNSLLESTAPAPSYNPTLGPGLISAFIPTPVLAPAPALPSFDEFFRQFMKAYLETNQAPKQFLIECKQPFKAKVLEVYYAKLHMDCYHFYQQCKDYFETAGAIEANRTPFAVFFLHKNISLRWAQFKYCHQEKKLTSITLKKFKTFLQKNLRESKSFIDII